MGVSLSAEDTKTGGQLGEGTYTGTIIGVNRRNSSNQNPQAVLTWSVTSMPARGAEIRDYVTFTDKTHFRIRNILTALGVPLPGTDHKFEDYDAMANWFAGAVIGKTAEFVVQLEDDRNGKRDELTGQIKRWPEIVGYNAASGTTEPAKGSDLDNDTSGFTASPSAASDDNQPLPF